MRIQHQVGHHFRDLLRSTITVGTSPAHAPAGLSSRREPVQRLRTSSFRSVSTGFSSTFCRSDDSRSHVPSIFPRLSPIASAHRPGTPVVEVRGSLHRKRQPRRQVLPNRARRTWTRSGRLQSPAPAAASPRAAIAEREPQLRAVGVEQVLVFRGERRLADPVLVQAEDPTSCPPVRTGTM